jgi:hypothetical protein
MTNSAPTITISPSGPPVKPKKQVHVEDDSEGRIGFWSALTTYLGYAVLVIFGHLRDFFGKRTGQSRYFNSSSKPAKVRPERSSTNDHLQPLALAWCDKLHLHGSESILDV